MKVFIVGHTYITSINRDKWKALVASDKSVSLDILVPTQWQATLCNEQLPTGIIEEGERYRVHALPAYSSGNEVRYRYKFRQLWLLLKEVKPDLIHCEQGASALSYTQLILCSKLLRLSVPFIFFTWINWQAPRRWSDLLLWDWIVRFNTFHTAGIIAGNQEAQRLLRQQSMTCPILVLPQLGVSHDIFKPKKEGACEKKITKRLLFVGRFVQEKGIFLLLEAFSSLARHYQDWELVFIGKGEEEASLQIIRDQLQLTDRVFIKPAMPHAAVAHEYHQADLLVLPSYDTPLWKEQFGHVLIEAMAARCCVLGSTAGEIPQVIADAGLCFEQKDIKDLTQKLALLMGDDLLRASYAEKGYQRALKEYTHQAIAEKIGFFWRQMKGYAEYPNPVY